MVLCIVIWASWALFLEHQDVNQHINGIYQVCEVQMYAMLSETTCEEVVEKMAHDKVELVE